jgi:hypothetical protein
VFAAYGWTEGIGDEGMLKSLLALDPERSARGYRSRLVRPRVGAPDTPAAPDREEHVGRVVARGATPSA